MFKEDDGIVSCVVCTAALISKNTKQQKKKNKQIKQLLENVDGKCFNDAGSLDVMECDEGEVCTAVAINTTEFGGK